MIGILPGTVNQIRIIQHCLHSEIDFTGKLLFCATSCYKCLFRGDKTAFQSFQLYWKAGGAEGTGGCGVEGVGETGSVFVGEGALCCSIPKFPCWGIDSLFYSLFLIIIKVKHLVLFKCRCVRYHYSSSFESRLNKYLCTVKIIVLCTVNMLV